MNSRITYIPVAGLVIIIGALVWSMIRPADRFTWFLEVMPIFVGIPILILTYRKFRFTDLIYALITAHALILIIGGHYTYAKMPVFDWIKNTFHLARNHYDRLGHFAQGFVPAMISRELLLRSSPLKSGKWLFTIVICICLAISATYELIEWATAEFTGTAADAFLGTQGDVWDSQKDMAFALVGAITALVWLAGYHDRKLETILNT